MTQIIRVATLCVQGVPAASTKDNVERLTMLPEIVRALAKQPDIHSIVLPGGFLRLSRALGATDFDRRREILSEEQICEPIIAAIRSLDKLSPGLKLVTGALAMPRDPSERTEQLCLAFNQIGPCGVARKIFPTRQESHGRRFVSPAGADYSSSERVIAIEVGALVLLHACYDLFGTADFGSQTRARRHAIRRVLHKRGKLTIGDEGFQSIRNECLSDFHKMITNLQSTGPLAASFATIHGFDRPGRDGYWQRHGIARASASLGGALVVAAAHFKQALPDPLTSTLAASGVPRSHLTAGAHRLAHRLAPIHSAVLETPSGLRGLLRVFQSSPPVKRKGAKK